MEQNTASAEMLRREVKSSIRSIVLSITIIGIILFVLFVIFMIRGQKKPECLKEMDPNVPQWQVGMTWHELGKYDGKHIIRATLYSQTDGTWELTTYGEDVADPAALEPHTAKFQTQQEGIAAAENFCPLWGANE